LKLERLILFILLK